jgi:broad specificity phosphatase PhoE
MKVILFRHGDKQKSNGSANIDDHKGVKLTDLGVEQVIKLGNILAERFPVLKNAKVIYSSPYARTIQSAEIVSAILKIQKIEIVNELGEFFATDNYLLSKEERHKMQEKAMQNLDWVSPDIGFSLNQKIERFKKTIKEICQKSKSGLVLISSHGAIIRHTVYSLETKLRPSKELIANVKIQEAGYTILDLDGENLKLEAFNVHDYLN